MKKPANLGERWVYAVLIAVNAAYLVAYAVNLVAGYAKESELMEPEVPVTAATLIVIGVAFWVIAGRHTSKRQSHQRPAERSSDHDHPDATGAGGQDHHDKAS